MDKTEMTPEMHCYLKGYIEAINDFGIWKDGTTTIGCMETPTKKVIERKLKDCGFTLEQFQDHG